MRSITREKQNTFKIALVDDEQGILDTLSIIVKRIGYTSKGFTNPIRAIEEIKEDHFDLLILDYIMQPIHGDEVIRKIRNFNKDLYILLLTGHKDLAPPLETIKSLDIQGYCEKSDKFDQITLLIESAVKAITQMKTIKEYKNSLNNMVNIVPTIYQIRPIESIIEDVLSSINLFIDNPNAFMLIDKITIDNNQIEKSTIYRGIGKFNIDATELSTIIDVDLLEKISDAKTLGICILTENGSIFPLHNELKQSLGILYIDKITSDYTQKLMEIYTAQTASALSNASLHYIVNIKNEELLRTCENLKKIYLDTIEALRLSVDARDVYTRGHSDRVSVYAVKLGEACGVNEKELELLRIAGIFHDIGKIGTADDILFKTERLDKNEYDEIKMHSEKGASILSAISMFSDVVPIIKCHHERIDGNGYPNGLKGDEIPFLAKILSVADAFDAMTTNRVYRTKLGMENAIKQLKESAGTQFDTQVVKSFLELLDNFEEIEEQINYLNSK